ncbi:MAG: hypothetical protein QOE69_1413 [Thermoleophilaceae bacterium]|jgi:hypothetical protein|nr:hypothetical protein [Thermoleophilaceae bacterium]MEA2407294.1 hypothetical protein [Thermoleophilaceae bacterium]
MTTDPPARFSRESHAPEAPASERDQLLTRLHEEQAAFDEAEAELLRRAGRIKALEQELSIAWHRVELLQEQLDYERMPRRRRMFRRQPPSE